MNCKIIQDNITGQNYHSFEELNKDLDDIQPQIAVVEETPRDVKNMEVKKYTVENKVYRSILNSVSNEDGKVFCLQAPGRLGKTYLLNISLTKNRFNGKDRNSALRNHSYITDL